MHIYRSTLLQGGHFFLANKRVEGHSVQVTGHLTLLSSPVSIFQAIIESNPFGITLKNMQKARKLGEDFAKELGCRTVACLHKKVSQPSREVSSGDSSDVEYYRNS